jgi:hypothetical protein
LREIFVERPPTDAKKADFSEIVNAPLGRILKREKPPHPRNLIGRRVRQLRTAAKPRISQEDLCGRVAKYGVVLTRQQVGKIEYGQRPVFDYEAVAIADALKVPVQQLYGR